MASDNPEAHCTDCLSDEIESWQDELERPHCARCLAEENESWSVKDTARLIEEGARLAAETPYNIDVKAVAKYLEENVERPEGWERHLARPLTLCKHDQPLNYYCARCAEEGKKHVGTRHLFDHKERKERPLARGVLDYFPDALLEVAHCSYVGNEQHNPGQPVHWAKEKSSDEADALLRHLIDRGTNDSDGVRHSAKVAWRALALLQREIDAERQDKS